MQSAEPVESRRLDALPKKTDNLNVTEHNLTLEELRMSEIRYRRLFEAARDGILIVDE
jgi:PAS domain-containing protein